MTILDEQLNKYGTTCKFLDCDDYCHMTKCVLECALRFRLEERFQELGFKHPNLAHHIYGYHCTRSDKCFKSKDSSMNVLTTDEYGELATQAEVDAAKIASEYLMDSTLVKQLYDKAVNIEIAELEKTIHEKQQELSAFKASENIVH